MSRLLVVVSLLSLVACGRPSAPETADDDDDDSASQAASVLSTLPEDGEAAAPVNGLLRVTWDSAVEGAALQLSAGGQPVAGQASLLAGGTLLSFTPGELLAAGKEHHATVTWQGGEYSWTFVTEGEATSPTDPLGLRGRTWLLDLSAASVLQPSELEVQVMYYLDRLDLAFMIDDSSDLSPEAQPGLDVWGGFTVEDLGVVQQDPCAESMRFIEGPDGQRGTDDDYASKWLDGQLDIRAFRVSARIDAIEFPLYDLTISGTLNDQSPDVEGVTLSTTFDTRALSFSTHETEEGLCQNELAGACELCKPGDAYPLCVPLLVDHIRGVYLEGMQLQERTCSQVITYAEAAGACQDTLQDWAPRGDGTYEGCPEHQP